MGQGIDQARRQVELTRQQLGNDVLALQQRVKAELDWRARLRRDGPRIAAIGGAVLGAAVVAVVLRRVVRGRRRQEPTPEEPLPVTLEAVAEELQALREQLGVDGRRRGAVRGGTSKASEPLWQKIAVGAVTAAAGAGGRYAARRIMERQESTTAADAPTAPAG